MLDGPNDIYRFSGSFEFKGWPTGISSISATRVGRQIIEFKDGGLVSILKDPIAEITGLISGERIQNFSGQTTIKDHINKIEAEIVYNPKVAQGYLKKISNWWAGSTQDKAKQPTDIIEVTIY